jgi:hypothetical protein
MAPAYAAVVIAREREMGTLDLLRVTLLSNRSIVLGKLAGCLVRLWPTVLTLAVLAVPRAAWGTGEGLLADVFAPYVPPWMSQGGEWVLGLFDVLRPWTNLALFSAAGLAASAWTRSSGAAVAASYASLFVLQVAGLWLQDSLGVFWTVLGCLFEVGGVVLLLEAAARGLEWT